MAEDLSEDLAALRRQIADIEGDVEKIENALNGMAQLLSQMDTFLREMIKAGVFEKALKEIEAAKPKIIV